MPQSNDNDVTNVLLKWMLGCLIVGLALSIYTLTRANEQFARTTRQDEFIRYQKIIDRLFLDPDSPAISDEDRKRVKMILEGK